MQRHSLGGVGPVGGFRDGVHEAHEREAVRQHVVHAEDHCRVVPPVELLRKLWVEVGSEEGDDGGPFIGERGVISYA